jgi:hypothetical protein
MRFLIIDSHKGNETAPQNLHWLNADKLRSHLRSIGHEVDLIWSYPSVNENVHGGYDCIIFNHASRYSYISDEWLTENDGAKLFYITNEYNLGEPLVLWSWVKQLDRKFHVIANHDKHASKVVKKYVDTWNVVNLNTLIINPEPYSIDHPFLTYERRGCIYYGSYRADRIAYFQKYFTGDIVVSTHAKNRERFEALGITGPFHDRIDWSEDGLAQYKTSLYIEDVSTHDNYNYLANRFYEALNYNVFPLFDISCKGTLDKSGYTIPEWALVDNAGDVMYITNRLPDDASTYLDTWRAQALAEKEHVLHYITNLVTS